jgi:cbb3-type cytochrome oxidase subunit 3
MDAFLNLALFVLVFYVITLYAGWRERRNTNDAAGRVEPRGRGKRVA